MFSKIIIASLIGTGAIGTSTVTTAAPTGIEIAAGTVRIESGNGKIVSAHLGQHSPFALTVNLQDGRKLTIKF